MSVMVLQMMPAKVADRDNNKPPLRKGLIPGLHMK
jgi:hypothetical protein